MVMATNKTERSYINRRLDDLAGYSTLHGLHFVIGRHFALRRIIWAILLLIGIGCFGQQLRESILKLASHKITINKEINYASELEFPAFTFCNVNMMKKSSILGTDSQYFLDQIDPSNSTAERKVAEENMNASFDVEQAVWEHGHKASDMILLCLWRNENCDYRNFTTFLDNKNGLCHTFNSGKSGNPILTSNTNSKDDGLTLVININSSEYYGPFSHLSTGVQAMIHDQDVSPRLITSYGIAVMPGVTTYFQLKKQEIFSLPLPFKSACGIRKLQSSETYSKEACLFECYTRLICQNCGCRYLGMPILPGINKTKLCSPKEINECDESGEDLSQCDCPLPCERVEYKINQNTAFFPSPSFWPTVFALLNVTKNSSMSVADELYLKSSMRETMMVIKVNFQDLNTEVITENPAYEFSDLIADVGGILGLFLGCSLLTILEFVDFLFVALFGARKSQNSYEVKTKESRDEEMQEKGNLNDAVEKERV